MYTADKLKNESVPAFSIIDSLIYIAVFSLLMLAVWGAIYSTLNSYRFVEAQFTASSEIRKASAIILRDLRGATFSDSGAYPIESFSANSIIFYTNADKDANIEKLKYFTDGAKLIREIIEPSDFPPSYPSEGKKQILLEHLRNDNSELFEFFDKDGNVVAQDEVLKIRTVKVNLRVDKDLSKDPIAYFSSFFIALRNLINDYESQI